VVIALISIMLLFSIPRFQGAVLTDSTKQVSRWIMAKVQSLKGRAVQDQKTYILHVGLDSNKMWITQASMSEEEREAAESEGFEIPGDVRVLDVEYPEKGKVSIGRADIWFHKQGYSDKALIHIENDDGEQWSYLIEPFLPQVKLYQEYKNLDD
jgi:Tfp pilus assembly protein FimT